jgi:hypothetical protein
MGIDARRRIAAAKQIIERGPRCARRIGPVDPVRHSARTRRSVYFGTWVELQSAVKLHPAATVPATTICNWTAAPQDRHANAHVQPAHEGHHLSWKETADAAPNSARQCGE